MQTIRCLSGKRGIIEPNKLSGKKGVGRITKPTEEESKQALTDLQHAVTQENATERPFSGEYDDFYQDRIYIDVASGEPLFSFLNKYDAGCGWPSFTKPIEKCGVREKADFSHGIHRVEVCSQEADSHLGHVFTNGPLQEGDLRCCINAVALRFVPVADLEKEGCGEYLSSFK